MNKRKTLAVAKWEFLRQAKSKQFILTMLVVPAVVVASVVLPTMFVTDGGKETTTLALLDETGLLFDAMARELGEDTPAKGAPRFKILDAARLPADRSALLDSADRALLAGRYDAVVRISRADDSSFACEFRSAGAPAARTLSRVETAFNAARVEFLLSRYDVDPSLVNDLAKRDRVQTVTVESEGAEEFDFKTKFFAAMAAHLAMFFLVVFTALPLARGLGEEKSNRIIEILFSSCAPEELLFGKFIGMAGLAFAQFGLWTALAIAFLGPQLAVALPLESLPVAGAFLVGGYLFYSAVFVGVGALAEDQQSSQQYAGYLTLALVFPVVLLVPIMQNPEGAVSTILSIVPFTAGSTMMIRSFVADPSIGWILASGAMLAAFTVGALWASSRIFAVAMMSAGSKITITTIKRALTASRSSESVRPE
ncbi:MAG: ABC transporter permease subunit [Ignavibacteriales bacterium]|nr:ABC transporter permease subunit [Ignavibacteriales bacterium]